MLLEVHCWRTGDRDRRCTPRCRQSLPCTAWPFSEVQNQFCGAGGYPGRTDRQQGPALRAPHSEL